MSALVLRGVAKRYGSTVALAGLDLEVPNGSVFGLVGPNGAGKTTTFGVATGTVRPDRGEVVVLGDGPFDARRHAGRVSVVPQDSELSRHSSARQLLTFFGRLQGLSALAAGREADRVLELLRLTDRADSRVRQLSHGMRRRLAVAQALVGDPALVLLDEPTGGLDPHLVVEMRELLRAQRGKRAIVVSTHILADLENTCDHVAFLERGKCVQSGPLDDVVRRSVVVRIRLGEPITLSQVEGLLDGRDPRVEEHSLVYSLTPDEKPAEAHSKLLPELIELGVQVVEVSLGDSLEEAYLRSRNRSR